MCIIKGTALVNVQNLVVMASLASVNQFDPQKSIGMWLMYNLGKKNAWTYHPHSYMLLFLCTLFFGTSRDNKITTQYLLSLVP